MQLESSVGKRLVQVDSYGVDGLSMNRCAESRYVREQGPFARGCISEA